MNLYKVKILQFQITTNLCGWTWYFFIFYLENVSFPAHAPTNRNVTRVRPDELK